MPAKAVAEMFVGAVPRGGIDRHTFDLVTQGNPLPGSISGGPDWGGEILILFITACYLAVIFALTARRTPVAPATLAVGARAGLVLGLVMYAHCRLDREPSGSPMVAELAWPLLGASAWISGRWSSKVRPEHGRDPPSHLPAADQLTPAARRHAGLVDLATAFPRSALAAPTTSEDTPPVAPGQGRPRYPGPPERLRRPPGHPLP